MIEKSQAHIFRLQAQVCKTLADPKRLMILHELRGRQRSVGQLASRLALAQANVSQHLAVLRARGIVARRRQGTSIYYSLAYPKIGEACDLVREVLREQLTDNRAVADSLNSSTRTT